MKSFAKESTQFLHTGRKGVAMLAAICVLVIIGMLAVQFHRMSREAQLNAFKFQASEAAQQLAESAMDEAFAYVFNQTSKSDTELFKEIVNNPTTPSMMDCTTGNLDDKNSKGMPIPVPLTLGVANSMDMGKRFTISVTARIIDFRGVDPFGRKFYGNEGVGTLELRARVEPTAEQKKYTPAACTITRHHDYKVVSIVSQKSKRPTSYVHNRLLDYALFITRGREEFETDFGSNLNPQETRLTIDAGASLSDDAIGKIYLGGTSGPGGKPVFIDITEDTEDFIPTPLKADKIAPPSPIDNADSLSLVTSIYPMINKASKDLFDEELRRQGKTGDAKYRYCIIEGIKGNFYYEKHPVTDSALNAVSGLTNEQKRDLIIARNGAWQIPNIANVPKDPTRPFTPGLKITPIERVSSILQGKIRKRFFHFGYLILDMADAALSIVYKYKKLTWRGIRWRTKVEGPAPLNDPTVLDKFNARRLPCYPNIEPLRGGEINIEYLANKFPDENLTSRLITSYDYGPGTQQDSFTFANDNPPFYGFESSMPLDDLYTNDFRPFSHASLWFRRDFPADRLEEYGILRKGELHLRGIVRVFGKVTLKGDGANPLKTFGKGILIADDIVIESGISKGTPDSICVLAVRGADKSGNIQNQTIFVKTDEEIQASLIAVGYGHGCSVKAESKLNLFGAMAVDRLEINRWKKNVEHKIVYDPALASDKDVYEINISRWINFKRVMESDD